METTTLAELRADARMWADERPEGYLTDDATPGSGIDLILNSHLRLVRAQLLREPRASEYFMLREDFTTIAGQSVYECGSGTSSVLSLPAVQMHELVVQWSTTSRQWLDPIDEKEYSVYITLTWGESGYKGYVVRHNADGMTIGLAPVPAAGTVIHVAYLPGQARLVASSDSFVGPEGMREMVAIRAAQQIIKMQGKPVDLTRDLAEATDVARGVIRSVTGRSTPRVLDVRPEGQIGPHRPWLYLPRP